MKFTFDKNMSNGLGKPAFNRFYPDPHIPMVQLLKKLYSFYLDSKDSAYCRLVERYWKTLSYKHIAIYNELQIKGANQGIPHMKYLVLNKNPFLELIPKTKDSFQGKYYPVSIVEKESNGTNSDS